VHTRAPSVRRTPGIAAAILMTLAAGTAAAHHGWGSYDADHPITVSGPIAEVSFQQPHVQVRVDASGKVWAVVLAPISRMQSRGATEEEVQVGRSISAYGYPSRTEANEMRAERITIDGRTYEMR
jgi:hypothetical protein